MIRRFIVLLSLLLAPPAFAQGNAPNHLAGSQSPYLLQHMYNPVDWYPWGEEALEKARAENKMIFVSVGYASCHWCHVMREESFENLEIAAFLNEFFVSIKIDRERRPDLDEQFMLATQVLTGSGGWPNNVILTPLGDPVFGGTYFPPDALLDVLQQMQSLWQEEPALVNAEGFKLAQYLKNYLTRTAAEVDLTPALLSGITDDFLNQMDDFNGGLGDAPKFPRESLFLFLMDQARRTANTDLLAAHSAALNGMITGGIHDQIGGGFHRYAIDPEWHVPHFEKMLYNQAMIGLMLVRSIDATGNPGHQRALDRTLKYLLRELRDPGGAFFAAQDADSYGEDGAKHEGAFYTWTPDQILAASSEGAYLNDVFSVTENGEFEGLNVLHLQPDFNDYPRLDPLLEDLQSARANRSPPDTDRKILLGWNGMTIAMLAEASHLTGRQEYWQAAANAARFLLANLKTETGYMRVWFDGTASVPAQLPDLGAFATGLIALHDYAPPGTDPALWLTEARAVADIMRREFGDVSEGYRMNATTEGFSQIIALDDGELPAGNALALQTFSRLSHRMQAPDLARDAALLAAAISGHAAEIPDQRAASLAAIVEFHQGETGPVRYVSGGAVRVDMAMVNDQVQASLSIKPGWHINANKPLEDYFVPTELFIGDTPVAASTYPNPIIKSLGFNPKELALYESTLTLTAPLSAQTSPTTATLILQACNDEICLDPEELIFTLW
ncbi:MAG TPA: DUF255 domain-containing protein [Aliiroseovarius sp.]|nr:DUF255 domain-containing protein [Aliiroseovarius sp.]